jgi:glycosyltransferase involved in cell wall biosynthesis
VKSVFHLITTINRGGAENQLVILVTEQIRQGLDVHIIYLKGEPELMEDFLALGASVHQELASRSPFLQPIKLRRLLKGKNALVHAHLPRAELVALFTNKRFRLITSRHNAEPFFPGAPRFISNFLSRLVERRSFKIIAISNAVKEYLISRGEVSNSENITVVHYGYTPKCGGAELATNQMHHILKLGTISRLANQKDIPTMFAAFSDYKSQLDASSLSILGSGPLELELRETAKKMGIADSVFFLGRSSLIYEFLSGLDVFVLTSKYEGFGMVLLEAMDAGVPVVASRNSAIPEVLGEDFLGLCNTGDSKDFCQKIDKLNDPEYRIEVLAQQRLRLDSFRAHVMCNKINLIYSL